MLCAVKALLSQPFCHPQAAAAVMAMDDNWLFAIRLQLRQSLGDLPHGNELRPADFSGREFVGFAAVEENRPVARLLAGAHVLAGDFKR